MSTATLPQGDWIRGISVQQPHATCILTGAKGIENRPKPWSWRGWILLHAGQRIDRCALRVPLIARTIRGRKLTTGAVIGIARLVDCHQDPEGSEPCTPWAQAGTRHLVLQDVQEPAHHPTPLPSPHRDPGGELASAAAGVRSFGRVQPSVCSPNSTPSQPGARPTTHQPATSGGRARPASPRDGGDRRRPAAHRRRPGGPGHRTQGGGS